MDEATGSAWARSLIDEGEFGREQERLGQVWTFLGHMGDLQRNNDWFTATLGGRSVFVQRFGDDLRGFENVCAHRFFPVRVGERGNGPLICGFHHWRYDKTGLAVGISNAKEVYGARAADMRPRLAPVEIETCGPLVFGRFPGGPLSDGLESYLGDGFPILKAICSTSWKWNAFARPVEANWRLMVHIVLDDYHTFAIHGRDGVNRKTSDFRYWQLGMHSAHCWGSDDTLESMVADCRNNRYRPTEYKVFNFFPNLAVGIFKASPCWYALIQQFVPVSPHRSLWRGWFFRTQFLDDEGSALQSLMRPLEPIRAWFVRRGMNKIGDEDHEACERLQTVAHQIKGWPLLSSQEMRIAWFEESYRKALG